MQEAAPSGLVLVVKILLMAMVDGFGLFLLMAFIANAQIIVAVTVGVSLIAVNIVYFRRGGLAAKYIIPGLIFLVVFQIFVIAYTIYVSFTNFGFGHNIDKSSAVEQILSNSIDRVPGSDSYPVAVLTADGQLFLLATAPDGSAKLGSADSSLAPAPDAVFVGGKAQSVAGYTTLTLAELFQQQEAVTSLAVPLGDSVSDGFLKTADARNAYIYESTFIYSVPDDTMTAPPKVPEPPR